jgi:hypothetical protein
MPTSGRNTAYIFLDVVQATVVRHECSNLLPILHQLDTSTLTDSRVRLLSLNATAVEVDLSGILSIW